MRCPSWGSGMRLGRGRSGNPALLFVLLSLLHQRLVAGIVSLGAEVFCARIPGLTFRQREMCKSSPDAMVAVGDGIRLATEECKYQFRHHRWNCSGIENPSSFGHVVIVDLVQYFLLKPEMDLWML